MCTDTIESTANMVKLSENGVYMRGGRVTSNTSTRDSSK